MKKENISKIAGPITKANGNKNINKKGAYKNKFAVGFIKINV